MGVLLIAALGLAALAVPPFNRPLLVYNASASMPLGLYYTRPLQRPERGDILLAHLPETARDLAAQRHYLPADMPLIKLVAALAGDRVCVQSGRVFIDGKAIASVLKWDQQGRSLLTWNECRRLGDDEFFLLSPAAGSFDSRYFGPVRRADIIAELVPLWVR